MPEQNSIIEHLHREQLLNTIPSGLFLVDRDKYILYWNDAAEQITGFTAAEAVGQPCSFLQGIPCGESCGLYDAEVAKPYIGGRCTIVTRDGRTLHLLKNIDYLRDSDGQIIGGIESFIDITRQQKLEDSLREQAASLENRVAERTRELARSESRFRTVLDTMDDLAYIANREFRITFINRAMQDQFGDVTGRFCYEILHAFEEPCPWCPMERVLNNRTVREERCLGNSSRIYEVIHSPLQSDDGQVQKLAVCRDITERKANEDALREANRELDAFAHTISHDLRGILAPVVTYMDFLRLQYHEVFDDQILQILGEVERQSERAIALLDNLLDLAQVGHVEPSRHPTDAEKLAREVLVELAPTDGSEGPKIRLAPLPKTWVPETLVYQVLANLMINACHYAGSTDAPIEVGCWTDSSDEQIYYVRDHGPGVSPRERDKIFDIFFRGKAADRVKGTGVGLAIVRKIALRCGGQAWVEDTPGGGATFCVSFPVRSPGDLGFTVSS